jgi:DNA/RNA endonuclease YhcR with UshA esterase domain
MKSFTALLAGILLPWVMSSLDSLCAQGQPEPRTRPSEATNHIGQTVVVKGTVAQVTKRDTIVYLNFEKKFPAQVFTAVIRQRDFAEFPEVEKVQGKTVEVDGKVELFKGQPQILLTKKSQLRVVEK